MMIVTNYLNNISFTKRGIALFDDENLVLKTDDEKLMQYSKKCGEAEQKLYQVSIDGADGAVDLTDFLTGGACFENVTDTFTYIITGTLIKREQQYERIKNLVHGKSLYLIDSTEKEYYKTGRLTSSCTHNKGYSEIVFTYIRQPYKMKLPVNLSIQADFYSTSGCEVNLKSGRKLVLPEFSSTKEHKVIFDGEVYNVEPNKTTIFPDIILHNGDNHITVVKVEPSTMKRMTWADIVGNNTVTSIYTNYKYLSDIFSVRAMDILNGHDWKSLKGKLWLSLVYKALDEADPKENLNINYEWGDL